MNQREETSQCAERWRWVDGYEGIYLVSNLGNVFSVPRRTHLGHQMKTRIDQYGYETVCLCKDNKRKSYRVHRLVASAFCKKYAGKNEVNHKDGDKANNKASNLEWVSRSENERHAFRVLGKKPNRPWAGKPRKFARVFSDEQVRAIRNSPSPGTHIAAEYGVSKTTIQNIRKRKIYKEVM